MTKLLPDGRPPNHGDICKAANFSPVIKACLALQAKGELSFIESIMAMVLALADINRTLQEQLVEMSFTHRTVYLTKEHKEIT